MGKTTKKNNGTKPRVIQSINKTALQRLMNNYTRCYVVAAKEPDFEYVTAEEFLDNIQMIEDILHEPKTFDN